MGKVPLECLVSSFVIPLNGCKMGSDFCTDVRTRCVLELFCLLLLSIVCGGAKAVPATHVREADSLDQSTMRV